MVQHSNVSHMLSEEAQIGKRVRVRAAPSEPPVRVLGTIEKRWGNPNYIALDVLFDDARSCSSTK